MAVLAVVASMMIGTSFAQAVRQSKTEIAGAGKPISGVDKMSTIDAAHHVGRQQDHLQSVQLYEAALKAGLGQRSARLHGYAGGHAKVGRAADVKGPYKRLISPTKSGSIKRQHSKAKPALALSSAKPSRTIPKSHNSQRGAFQSIASIPARAANRSTTGLLTPPNRPAEVALRSIKRMNAPGFGDEDAVLARMLSWREPVARSVVAQEPAKRGPASPEAPSAADQIEVRHHREAQAILAQQVQPQPSDLPARMQAVQSPGQPGPRDTAIENLDLALGQRQIFSDLRSLRDRILDAERPVTNLDARQSGQSDDVDIAQAEASQDLFFDHGRNRLRLGVQSAVYSPPSGSNTSVYSLGGNGNYRFNDWVGITGDVWLNKIDGSDISSRQILTYDTFVTVWPNDVVRVDIDANRKTFDNIKSLRAGITADTYGASVDYMPINNVRFTARGSNATYSDSNKRESIEAESVWRVHESPVIELGLRASGFHYSKLLDSGYFNPDRYFAAEGMFRIQSQFTEKLGYEFAISGGSERVEPGDSKPLIKSSAQLVYELTEHVTLDGGISYFSSRDSNSSGFARTTAMLGLHFRPGKRNH